MRTGDRRQEADSFYCRGLKGIFSTLDPYGAGSGPLRPVSSRFTTTSERVQRRIERLLDQAEEALETRTWEPAAEFCRAALALDPDNTDALAFLEAATRASPGGEPHLQMDEGAEPARSPSQGQGGLTTPAPTSFANGRYQVSKFLGEGGKKRVYQAHDTLLDREVAFALIKTEGFDDTSKERITREAQAMGRLGVHPNIVAVLDLGQEDDGTPYMVTELMGGGDVEDLLESVGAGGPSAEGPSPSSQPPPAAGRGGKRKVAVDSSPRPNAGEVGPRQGRGTGEGAMVGSQSGPETGASADVVGAYGPSGEGPTGGPGPAGPAPTCTSHGRCLQP